MRISNVLPEAALEYAARGWPVFPLRPGDKIPLIAKARGGKGVHDATTDADQIRAWWDRDPRANIGLAAGPHWWVLDLDYYGLEAARPDGATTYTALVERYGHPPRTVTQLTGGGGWQLFFVGDERIKNGVKFLPGLDTRSTGGYVVAPPSVHPSGRHYAWRRGHGPDELEIAIAPDWLVCLAEPVEVPASCTKATSEHDWSKERADRYVKAALERACDAISRAPIGQQANTLDHEAYGIGRLVAGGVMPKAHARAQLEAAGDGMANESGRPPWTGKQITARIDRAFARAQSAPRVLELQ